MAKLLFKCPVFREGINLTVRRGIKWDAGEKKGVEIAATDKPDHVLYVVDITTEVMPFAWILDHHLEWEHDPDCRTFASLTDRMKQVYGDRLHAFDEHEIVTLVWFRIPSDPYADSGDG